MKPGAWRFASFGPGGRGAWRILVAAIALAMLATVDWFILAASFLYRPDEGVLLSLSVPAIAGAGLVLKRGWLVFAAQNIISGLTIVRVAEGRVDLSGVFFTGVVMLIGNGLAWLVVRAMPRRGGGGPARRVNRPSAPPPPA